MKKFFLVILFVLQITCVIAAPREIIIVRHADKLSQQDHGPAVDPTGYERAVHLAFYFLKTYGTPDYIVAANPNDMPGHVHSIPEYPALAKDLLTNIKFKNKLVLVCWDHHTIPNMVTDLGIVFHTKSKRIKIRFVIINVNTFLFFEKRYDRCANSAADN